MADVPLSHRKAIVYSMGSVGAGLFYAFNNFVLPLYLALYTQNAIIIGWLSSTRSLEQSIIQPLVGAASDRTWTRWGRRIPYFAVSMPLVALLFVLTAQIPHDSQLLWLVAISVFVFSLLFNIGIDPYTALFADITPVEQRGRVSSISAVFGFIGQVTILLAGVLLWQVNQKAVFYLLAVGVVGGFGVTALFIRERKEAIVPGQHMEWRHYVQTVMEHREAMKYLFVQFLYGFGVNAATPFLTLFAVNELHVAQEMALGLAAVLLVTTALFSIPAGWLGDRLGRKKVYGAGLVVLGVFALTATFAQTVPQFVVLLILIGIGNAAGSVLWYPILTELVPAHRMGEFTGIATVFQTGAIFFSVLVAGELINLNLGGLQYRSIFIVTGIFILLSVVLLQLVRVPFSGRLGFRSYQRGIEDNRPAES